MKHKTQTRLIILSIAFVLICIIYFAKDSFLSLFKTKPETVFSIQPQSINDITLIDNKKQIKLYKKDTDWYTKQNSTDFKADTTRIQSLTDSIAHLTKEDIISNNRNKRAEFGIEGQKVVFKINNTQHTVFIGKQIDSKNYIAVDNDADVFTADGFTGIYTPADYRDLTVRVIQDENKVTSITENYDSMTVKLDKQKDAWYLNGKKVKKERVDFLINDLKTLQATDITTSAVITGLNSAMSVNVMENGKKVQADFYQKDAQQYVITLSNTQSVYTVQAAYIQSLKKEPKDFTE